MDYPQFQSPESYFTFTPTTFETNTEEITPSKENDILRARVEGINIESYSETETLQTEYAQPELNENLMDVESNSSDNLWKNTPINQVQSYESSGFDENNDGANDLHHGELVNSNTSTGLNDIHEIGASESLKSGNVESTNSNCKSESANSRDSEINFDDLEFSSDLFEFESAVEYEQSDNSQNSGCSSSQIDFNSLEYNFDPNEVGAKNFESDFKLDFDDLDFCNSNSTPFNTIPLFNCDQCSKAFRRKGDLSRHINSHYRNAWMEKYRSKVFICDTCGDSFKREVDLNHHSRCHEQKYTCEICGVYFSAETSLKLHIKSHDRKLPFEICDYCDKPFESNAEMLKHLAWHSLERQFHCVQCDASFRSASFLESHMKTCNLSKNTVEKDISLELIPIDPSIKLLLNSANQLTSSTGDDASQGEIALETSFSPTDFDDLNIVEVVPCSFSCDKCDRSFGRSTDLNRHAKIHNENCSFQCLECEQYFPSKDSLQKHRLVHVSDRPYRCDLCENSFKRFVDLKKHELAHFETRAIKCALCGMSFKKESHLKRHILTIHRAGRESDESTSSLESSISDDFSASLGYSNTVFAVVSENFVQEEIVVDKNNSDLDDNAKKHICDICQGSFQTSRGLKRHKATHTASPQYHCDKCSKSFKQMQYLKRHKLQVHSNDRGFKCHLCRKTFKCSDSLRVHVVNKHLTETMNFFSCTTCRRKFPTEQKLRKHCEARPFFCYDLASQKNNTINFDLNFLDLTK